MTNHKPHQRPAAIGLAVIAVLMLSLPSATAAYEWLMPIRGQWAALSAAAGFELTYLALACMFFTTVEAYRSARRLQFWAVLTAITLNSIYSYGQRHGVDLSTGASAWSTLDLWLASLSVIESIPLAGLAFGVSMVLHRLIADDRGTLVNASYKAPEKPRDVREPLKPIESPGVTMTMTSSDRAKARRAKMKKEKKTDVTIE